MIIYIHGGGRQPPKISRAGGTGVSKKLTNAQTNALLETIAKRLEERIAVTPKEAANVVRESKTVTQEIKPVKEPK